MGTNNNNQNNSQEKASKKEEYTEIVVRRNKLNMVTICFTRKGIRHDLRLFPGVNRITNEDVIACIQDDKCNKVWKGFLESSKSYPHGCHEIITGSVKKGTKVEKAFTAMDAATCKRIIEETCSIEQLELMYADEEKHKSRKTVLEAIMGQIDEQKSDTAGQH